MISPEQLRMARAGLKLGVRDLAELADVSAFTISRFEGGQGGLQVRTAQKLIAALEAAGARLLEPDEFGPGVRLRKTGPAE